MFTRTTALTPSELKSAIVRDPLIVKPDTTVMGAIAHMSGLRTLCEATKTVDGQLDELHLEVRSSCVLVVEDGQLLGILTERDVVRLSAEQCALEQLTIREVMIHPVVTLHESGFTDLFFGINLLQQYRIRHLPILDEQERVIGLVTHESLRQTSRPVDLLRLRVVSEVMTRQVICAVPNSSMLAIAQLMAQHHVSSVMIIQTRDSQAEPRQIPVGILTERDIVQFQALGLNLATCLAQAVMSTPIFSVRLDDSLWVVQQIMEQRLIRRLAVTGEQGELLGIVTQTSLLQALNPLELYKLAEVLEAKVVQLEAEKIELLETRTIELEQQVEARTIALKAKADREKLVLEIATQIRSSLSLQTILDTTVKQVRQLLGCDRVNIWQFKADWQTVVVAESTYSSLSLVGQRIDDTCFKQQQVEKYRRGYILIVPDIYKAQMSDCHRQMLIGLQTRAKILVPLLCGEELWGLLNVTESQHAREWQPEEVELLQALSVQLAIAIQQATTYQKLQEQLSERQQAEARLRESEQRYVTLTAAAPVGIFRTDAEGNSIYINQWCCQMLGLPPEATTANGWQQALYPDDRENVIAETIRARQENRPFQQEYRILRPDGTVIWVLGRAVAERDAHGQTIGYVGTITDISDRKRTELTLQKLVTGTAAVTGDDFFPALVRHIAEALDIGYAIVTELVGDQLHTLGFWSNGALQPEISYHPANTPCEYALRNGEFYCESQVQRIFPDDLDLVMMQADSYLGISLKDDLGNAIGNLCILDMQPLPAEQRTEAIAILQVFAARAAAELQRKRANDALHHLNQDLEARVEQRTIELQAREAQLRDLFDNATDMIQSVSREGRVLFVNTAWKETLGYNDAELEQLFIFQVIHPDEQVHYQIAMQSLFAGAFCLGIETRFMTKDGREIIVEGNINCQFQDGIPIATRGIFRDITQRKQAENALRESQQFLQTVLDTFPLFVFWKSRESVYLGCNQNFAIAAGVASPAEIIGKTDYDLSWGTSEADLYRADDRQCMDSGTAQLGIIETQYQANGITMWVETNKVPLRDLKGELIGILGTYQDITDRKLLEEQLVCSENKMRSIFESITDIILTINFQGQKIASIDIPPVSNSLINTLYIEIVNQTTNVLLLDSSNNDWLQRVLEVINSGKATQFDYSLTIGASLLWFSAVVSPINTTAVTWVARDISDRKQAELRLEQQAEQQRLLGSVTQRMRSSLNLDEILNATVKEVHQFLKSDRVLVYRVFPGGTGAAIAESVLPNWPNILNIVFPEEVFPEENYDRYLQGRIYALSDREKENQSVLPCLIEFLAEIQVRAKLVVPIIQNQTLWGLLIAHQCDRPRQWQDWEINLFKQISNQLAIAIQQAGLFSQLQQELTERQQAEAKLTESNQQLAVSNQELARATRLKDEFLANMSHELRTPLNAILGMTEGLQEGVFGIVNEKQIKALQTVERSGQDAIASLKLFEPDVILLDVMMPGIDGIEVCKRIKAMPQWEPIPIIMVTALNTKEDLARCLEAGADDFISKPVNGLELRARVKSMLRIKQQYDSIKGLSNLQENTIEILQNNLDELCGNLVSTLPHELNTPLNGIFGVIGLLMDEYQDMTPEEIHEFLLLAQQSALRLEKLTKRFLQYAQLEMFTSNRKFAEVRNTHHPQILTRFLIESAIKAKAESVNRADDWVLDHLENVEISMSERDFRSTLDELLDNAFKFSKPGTPVKVSSQLKNETFHLSISDRGRGMTEEQIAKIGTFTQFERKYYEQQGIGLGLKIVKKIIEFYGGEFSISSVHDGWTTVHIELSIKQLTVDS